MNKTIGKFGYTIAKMKKSDNQPFRPFVHIYLKKYTTEENGVPIVTPQLMSEREINGNIKQLKDDLENVGRKAKTALVRATASN